MNTFKKIAALILVCLMALTVIGCHPKNEIAVTIDGHEYTSAYYMCALINAYMEGQSEVYNNLSDEELSSEEEIDYFSKEIDDKSFSDWVKDRAIETLKEVSVYKSLCRDNELELSDEERENSEYYASFYWSSYGYSTIFEPNGVSESTFTDYMIDSSYADLYFEYLYGEDGEEEIKAKTIKSTLYEDFLIADILEVTFSEETDEEIEAIEKQLTEYAEKIDSGKMTFEEAYADYYDEEEHSHDEDEDGPKDPHAEIIGADGTGYEYDYYDEIAEMEIGEVKLIEDADGAGFVLVVKQDIEADDYYLEDMDMTIRYLLKEDEYYENMSAEAEKLEADINNYAVNQFKVKNIVEPEYY